MHAKVVWIVGMMVVMLLAGCVTPVVPATPRPSVGAGVRTTSGCRFDHTARRGSTDVDVAISGDHRDDVWVDVYAPGIVHMDYYGKILPLDVMDQYDKAFTDTGAPYLHQTYSSYDLKAGRYRVTARYGGEDYEWTVNVQPNTAVTFYVDCG